jgi:hypothetical protein
MKKQAFSYTNSLVVGFAIIFFALLIVFYFWATGAIITQVRRSLILPSSASFSGFNITGASKLDLRGFSGQLSSSSPQSVPAATSTQP